MTRQRFFVRPGSISGVDVVFDRETAHQVRNVLRMRPGDSVLVLDNLGWEYEVTLREVRAGLVAGQVTAKRAAGGEPLTGITLYQGMLKGRSFELVLQKGTELGVAEFVPVISERCVVADQDDVEKRRERWERIVAEAAEQSRRGKLPQLQRAVPFPAACERAGKAHGLALILWEEESSRSLKSALSRQERPTSIGLFVGPEGGFTPEEVRLASSCGIVPVGLGPRILRAETAGLVAVSAILFASDDLQPQPS